MISTSALLRMGLRKFIPKQLNVPFFGFNSMLIKLPSHYIQPCKSQLILTFHRFSDAVGDDNKINISTTFSYYGFNEEDIHSIISRCPEILRLSNEKLNNVLHSWKQCNFGEDRVISFILEHPSVLFIQPKQIESLYSYLSSQFKKSDLFKIFLNAPKLLVENIAGIEEKMIYLVTELVLPISHIVNSGILGYSLHHIKERYEFLIRVGVYKIVDKRKIDHFNPKADVIVSSSDEVFATKIAGVSYIEYQVFQQLFDEEKMENYN